MSIKILITGSREITQYQYVYDALDLIYSEQNPMIVIHGAARGADSIADAWAVFRTNVTVVRVPADWKNDNRAAGPIRNSRMLELNPDIVLAFFQEGAANRGTAHMAQLARAKGYDVRAITVPIPPES